MRTTRVAAAALVADRMAEIVERYAPYLVACRRKLVAGLAAAPFSSALSEYFQGGKAYRALLVFLAAEAVGGDPAAVTPAAEALELCHGASLVHDDIIDEADQRRGRPALHAQLGRGAALVLGDYLLLRSFVVLAEAGASQAGDRALEAMRLLGGYGQECCRGQVEELVAGGSESEAAYFSLVEGKTASLFAAALTIGASLAGGTRSEVEALRTFGVGVGTAFQIRDDVLDLIGDPETLGKPIGNSLVQGRPMLPLIYLQECGSPQARDAYRQWQRAGGDRRTLVTLLQREGIFEQVRSTQQRFLAAALAALDDLRHSDATGALRLFAAYASAWTAPGQTSETLGTPPWN